MAESIDRTRSAEAMRRLDEINAQDPRLDSNADGSSVPHELAYARMMSAWLGRLYPNAPEPLQLAARCQHIRRWDIPRDSFPMDRPGYLAWRKRLQDYHGQVASPVLRECGYDDADIARVCSLLRKERLKADPDAQALEDVIAIVFLESEFAAFAHTHAHEPDKIAQILRRTWAKMSDTGRSAASSLSLPPDLSALVEKALGSE